MKFTTTIGHIFLVEIAQNRIFLAEVRAQTPLSPIWWRHLWARSRPKLDVKKTHTQFIKYPIYIHASRLVSCAFMSLHWKPAIYHLNHIPSIIVQKPLGWSSIYSLIKLYILKLRWRYLLFRLNIYLLLQITIAMVSGDVIFFMNLKKDFMY